MTQTAKHTPGPWRIKSEPTASSGDVGDLTAWYSFTAKADKQTFAEHEANARLMQAAPDLLALAYDFMAIVDESPRDKGGHRAFIDVRSLEAFGTRARAAIAKAEGR